MRFTFRDEDIMSDPLTAALFRLMRANLEYDDRRCIWITRKRSNNQ